MALHSAPIVAPCITPIRQRIGSWLMNLTWIRDISALADCSSNFPQISCTTTADALMARRSTLKALTGARCMKEAEFFGFRQLVKYCLKFHYLCGARR